MKLFGIPVKVEGSFLVLSLFLASSRMAEPVLLVEWLLVVFVSILLHELGHALAVKASGHEPRITLYSMGGLTSWRGEVSAARHVIISLAGPFAGFLFGGLVYLARPLFEAAPPQGLAQMAFRDLIWVNVGWGIFNLLPILPLDGGQALLSVERGALRRRTQWVTPAISLLLAAAVAAWAFSIQYLWVAFLGCWFAYSNGHALFRMLQARRERGLHSPLEEANGAFNAADFATAAARAREVLRDARTDGLKAQASRLLVFSLAYKGDADAAEVEKELRRHQVFFGEDPYLEGFVLLKAGRAEEAVGPLRKAFESSPTKEAGLALYNALVRARQFDEALELCAREPLAESAWPAYVNLQSEAFEGGAFGISARAGESAFRLRPDAQVAYNVACAYARGGEGARSLEWLDAAVREGFDGEDAFASDADLDSLRSLPGFETLRAKLHASGSRRTSGARPS
jgi:Zn-dependent protease